MANWLIIGIMVILLDIFIGLPLDYILTLQGVDWLVLLTVGLLEILLPFLCFMLEMRQRSKYPIRVEVSFQIGKDAEGRPKVVSYEDRIGLLDIKGSKDQKTGAKEWRLMTLNKAVQNFGYEHVYEKQIWMGFKKAQHAKILAVQGLKGEEFYPIKYHLDMKDEKGGEFKPVFSGDRALMHYKMQREIDARNTKENFWKDHLFDLLKIGGDILIIIMLFLCFLQLVDVSKNLQSAAGSNAACATAYQEVMNNTASAKTPTAGNVGGIPFGIG
jgi:hypothetical protein